MPYRPADALQRLYRGDLAPNDDQEVITPSFCRLGGSRKLRPLIGAVFHIEAVHRSRRVRVISPTTHRSPSWRPAVTTASIEDDS